MTEILVGWEKIKFELWDTAGQEDFDRIRLLSYPNTDVIICCYSVDSQTSLANVRAKWHPEFTLLCPNVPFLLCGTKSDLRGDPHIREVDISDAKNLAKTLGAKELIECSAMTGENLKSVFDQAIVAVLRPDPDPGQCCVVM